MDGIRALLMPASAARIRPIGPQGPTIFTDVTGNLRLGFAAWKGAVGYANGGVWALWTARLSFVNGKPTLN